MIRINLSRILGERRIKMSELAEATGISKTTVLHLYHEKAKGVTFEVMDKICAALDVQPGVLLLYVPDEAQNSPKTGRK